MANAERRSDFPPMREASAFGQSDTGVCKTSSADTSEQAKRLTRAARFANAKCETVDEHIGADCATVDGCNHVIGTLDRMCSVAEAKRREDSHQLDIFEQREQYTDNRYAFVTKKYERSSAGKGYHGEETRTLEACWTTVRFLVSEVLSLDENKSLDIIATDIQYSQIYSYMHDRLRAVRVDLLVQQPLSTTHRCFIESHECCIRFELLSRFLFKNGYDVGAPGHFVEKLSTEALSQTIEPLLHAYHEAQQRRHCQDISKEGHEPPFISSAEMVMHRYIILLMLGTTCAKLVEHLATLSSRILKHPLLAFALNVVAAFHAEDHSRVLRLYRQADFLSAVSMSSIVNFARVRTLWFMFQAYPKSVGDRISLARLKNMLAFASIEDLRQFLSVSGVHIEDGGLANEERRIARDGLAYNRSEFGEYYGDRGEEMWISACIAEEQIACLPKKGTLAAEEHPLLTSHPPSLTSKLECADRSLVVKFKELNLNRRDIVLGYADPKF